MKTFVLKRSRFKLDTFLAALHGFSVQHMGDGNPLPGVSGGIVYIDFIDLIEALASDTDDEYDDLPDDSLARLEMGLTLYAQFAAFDGESAFDCADGTRVDPQLKQAPPDLEGIKFKERWVVIYSKYDIGCALEKHSSPECLGHDPGSALRLARAAVLYGLKQ